MTWEAEYERKVLTAEDALSRVKSGMRVYIQPGCAEPETLVEALIKRAPFVSDVQVVHLLTKDSIEMRVWETLQLKKSLFAGVFDSPAAEVSFAALGRKSVLQAVKEIFAGQPGRPKPVVERLNASTAFSRRSWR